MHLVDITSDLIGKPYKSDGVGPLDYDCYGLAARIRLRAGLYFPKYQIKNIHETIKYLKDQKLKIDKLLHPLPYCVVSFRSTGHFITHIGIVMPSLYKFIHIIENQTVCIERLDSVLWRSKLEGFYEFPISHCL